MISMSAAGPSTRAASPTSFISRFTARLMLGAIRSGIRADAASSSRRCAASRPVVPTTRGTPCSRHQAPIARAAAGAEKSTITSTDASAGTAAPSGDAHRRHADRRAGVLAQPGMAVPYQRRRRAAAQDPRRSTGSAGGPSAPAPHGYRSRPCPRTRRRGSFLMEQDESPRRPGDPIPTARRISRAGRPGPTVPPPSTGRSSG